MSGYRSRVTALQALVAGSRIPAVTAGAVLAELNEVATSGRVRRLYRRLLLQVLHGTRALDSALVALIVVTGGAAPTSLGNALVYLQRTGLNGNRLPEPLRRRYQRDIVAVRNLYMHQAGAFPATVGEVAQLLDDMQACLADALNL
jgi:hypothetical protein